MMCRDFKFSLNVRFNQPGELFTSLENFDADIFFEITGIKV